MEIQHELKLSKSETFTKCFEISKICSVFIR